MMIMTIKEPRIDVICMSSQLTHNEEKKKSARRIEIMPQHPSYTF